MDAIRDTKSIELMWEAVSDYVEALSDYRLTILSEASILATDDLSGESSNWPSEKSEFASFENTVH